MSGVDVLTMTVAALAGLECVTGRIAAMHWREHRPALMLGYLLAAGVCILAASLIWQGADAAMLDFAAWGIALHLVLTWRDWRNGAPPDARRGRPAYMQTDLMVSAPMIGHRDGPLEPLDRRRD